MCLTNPLKQTEVLYEASRVAFVNYKLELARGILPSASAETESCAGAAADLQHALKAVQCGE